MDLKLDYGKDLIATFIGYPKELLKVQKKSEKVGLVSADSVYYIKEGTHVIGKLAIREQQTFRDLGLTFIYSTKDQKPREIQRKAGKNTRGEARKKDRKKQNRKSKRGYTD